MRKIKEVLRLKLEAKLSHAQIAAALGISKGVVTKYVGLAAIAGLDWSAIQDKDEATLERQLLVAPQKPPTFIQPDYGRMHQELRRKGMTLMLLWEEHRANHADSQTYSYAQFCVHYRRFAKQLKRSMRQIHRAGEKLFIDFAGPTMALTDGSRAHIFVAAMGASSYTFACAMPAAHRAHMEWTPDRLIQWGLSIGPATAVAVTQLLEKHRHPEHGYRACLGLLSLAKRYGKPRLEVACSVALQIGTCQYRHVRDILANNRDTNTQTTTSDWISPHHAHVRGPDYYQ